MKLSNAITTKNTTSVHTKINEHNFDEVSYRLGNNTYRVKIGEKNDRYPQTNEVILTKEWVQDFGRDMETAAKIFVNNRVAIFVTEQLGYTRNRHIKNLLLTALCKNNMPDFFAYGVDDPIQNSAYLQGYLISQFPGGGVSLDVQLLLQKELGSKKILVKDYLQYIYHELSKVDIIDWYQKSIAGKKEPTLFDAIKKYEILRDNGVCKELDEIEQRRRKELEAREKQSQDKEKKPKEKPQIEETSAPPFSPDYDPKDSEKQEQEPGQPIKVIGYFTPEFTGYLKQHSMQMFGSDLKWSLDTKDMKPTTIVPNQSDLVYHATVKGGLTDIPIPYGYEISDIPLGAQVYTNSGGDMVIETGAGNIAVGLKKTTTRADKYSHTNQLFDRKQTTMIDQFLQNNKGKPLQTLYTVAEQIKSKWYDTKYQGTLRDTAANAEQYFENLWMASHMECYSANTLFVGIARQLGFEAKLSVGYHNKFVHEGKGYITKNDGHARAEVKLNGQRTIIDTTPTQMPPQEGDEEGDGEDEENKDKKEEKEFKDPLDDISPEELDQMRKEFQKQNLKELSDDARALASQFDLQDVLKFHKLREETKDDREKVSSQLKKFFEKKEEEMYRQWIHTKKQTGQIDINKMISENPMLLVGDPRALEKIQDQKIYREYARQYEEKTNFPKEFQITMLIDLSGSMTPERKEIVIKDFAMMSFALAHLAGKLKKFDSKIVMNVIGFGTTYQPLIDKPIVLDTSNATNTQLMKVIKETQSLNLGGNQDHELLQDLYGHYSKESSENKIRLGMMFTDGAPDDAKQVGDRLSMLKNDLDIPFVASLVGDVKQSDRPNYEYYIEQNQDTAKEFLDIIKKEYGKKIG